MEDLFRIGVITDTHGIRGEIKLYPTTDDPDRIKDIPEVILITQGGEKMVLQIERAYQAKDRVIVKFKGIDNINDIEKYKKCELYVTRENAIPLEEGEYYISDLIGLDVFDESDRLIGKLTDVLKTGANDVYEVATGEGKKPMLIPAIKQCILETDIEKNRMTVHLLPGLEDL